jgi:Predicted membrane protein
VAYLASTLVRAFLKENYKGAATLSAALGAVAIVEKFTGLQIPIALMVEAECIVVAGYLLRQPFLYELGGLLFLPAVVHLLAVDVPSQHKMNLLGFEINAWSPVAAAMAAVFCINRLLTRSGPVYTFAASALISLSVHEEFAPRWVGVAWALMALAALAAGVLRDRPELRLQAYLLGFLTFWQTLFVNLNSSGEILTVSVVVASFYAGERLLRGRRPAAELHSIAGTILLTALIHDEVHGRLLTVALGIEAAALLSAGFLLRERVLRLSGLILFLFCIVKLFAYDLRELDTVGRILSFILLGLMLLGASWIYTRFREQIRRLL